MTALSDSSTYVARVTVQGLIRNDQERTKALDRLAKSNARAVILHVDSPGGTAAGAEQLYDSLRRSPRKKPMVVVVDGLAASGGYIAALSATTWSHAAPRWSARSACCSSIRSSPA